MIFKNISIKALAIFLLLIAVETKAQITIKEAYRADTTAYRNPHGVNDSILFFYYPDDNGNETTPTLQATVISMSDSLFNFRWYVYDSIRDSFTDLNYQDVGINVSSFSDAESGGYRVRITNDFGNIDTLFTVWLNKQLFGLNKPQVISSNCTDISLSAYIQFEDTFAYSNPYIHKELYFINELKFNWEVNDSLIPRTSGYLNIEAPTEETRYWLRLTDSLGEEREEYTEILEDPDYEENQLIAVKADFYGTVRGDTNSTTENDTIKIEASRGVMFYNESSPTAELFEWSFFQHPDYEAADYITTSELFEPVDSIYYRDLPTFNKEIHTDRNTYQDLYKNGLVFDVYLKVYGPKSELVLINQDKRCVDSIMKYVLVETPYFPKNDGKDFVELPNVFTPNASPGQNDYLHYIKENKPKSISEFSIKIYNRYGNKIYEYEDNDGSWHPEGQDEPGWDGTTRFGGKVKPGVYYYSIKALGWNNQEFESYGFFHVFSD